MCFPAVPSRRVDQTKISDLAWTLATEESVCLPSVRTGWAPRAHIRYAASLWLKVMSCFSVFALLFFLAVLLFKGGFSSSVNKSFASLLLGVVFFLRHGFYSCCLVFN